MNTTQIINEAITSTSNSTISTSIDNQTSSSINVSTFLDAMTDFGFDDMLRNYSNGGSIAESSLMYIFIGLFLVTLATLGGFLLYNCPSDYCPTRKNKKVCRDTVVGHLSQTNTKENNIGILTESHLDENAAVKLYRENIEKQREQFSGVSINLMQNNKKEIVLNTQMDSGTATNLLESFNTLMKTRGESAARNNREPAEKERKDTESAEKINHPFPPSYQDLRGKAETCDQTQNQTQTFINIDVEELKNNKMEGEILKTMFSALVNGATVDGVDGATNLKESPIDNGDNGDLNVTNTQVNQINEFDEEEYGKSFARF